MSFFEKPYDELSQEELDIFNNLALSLAINIPGAYAEAQVDSLTITVPGINNNSVLVQKLNSEEGPRKQSKSITLNNLPLTQLDSGTLHFYYDDSQGIISRLILYNAFEVADLFNRRVLFSSQLDDASDVSNLEGLEPKTASNKEEQEECGTKIEGKENFRKESIIPPEENQVGMRVKAANRDCKFDFYLAPAMQSSFRMPGGRDIPNALPGGLNIRIRPNISKVRIPGSKPVYQNLGIDSIIVTVVGAFTGGNITGTFFQENTSDPYDKEQGSLDTYRDYNEFLSLIDLGEELDVEINLNQNFYDNINQLDNSGLGLSPVSSVLPRERFEESQRVRFFSESKENENATTYLRLQNGNPQFRGFLRDMQYSFVRDNLSYYVMQFEVTDFNRDLNNENCLDYQPARLFNFVEETIPVDEEENVRPQLNSSFNGVKNAVSIELRNSIYDRLSSNDRSIISSLLSKGSISDSDWTFKKKGSSIDTYNLVYISNISYLVRDSIVTVLSGGKVKQQILRAAGSPIITFQRSNFYVFEPEQSAFTGTATNISSEQQAIFDRLSTKDQTIIRSLEDYGIDGWDLVSYSNTSFYGLEYLSTKEYVWESLNNKLRLLSKFNLSEPKKFVLRETLNILPNRIYRFKIN